jgi:hypothetical protein
MYIRCIAISGHAVMQYFRPIATPQRRVIARLLDANVGLLQSISGWPNFIESVILLDEARRFGSRLLKQELRG